MFKIKAKKRINLKKRKRKKLRIGSKKRMMMR